MRLLLCILTANIAWAQNIVIKGSDYLGAKMVPQLAEGFKAAGNKTEFEISAEGSSKAYSSLLDGTANIGMSMRLANAEEKDIFREKGKELVEHVAAFDMIAVVVNSNKGIRALTLKQLEGIYTGEITDWVEVGGRAGKIDAYTRNTTSGTYKTFQKLAMSGRDYGVGGLRPAGFHQMASAVVSE